MNNKMSTLEKRIHKGIRVAYLLVVAGIIVLSKNPLLACVVFLLVEEVSRQLKSDYFYRTGA